MEIFITTVGFPLSMKSEPSEVKLDDGETLINKLGAALNNTIYN